MGYLERQPYAQDLGVMSVFARRAPMFLMAAVLFTVLVGVFTAVLLSAERENLGEGGPGSAITIGEITSNATGSLYPVVAVTGEGVSEETVTCTSDRSDGEQREIDLGLGSSDPFEYDGATWVPVAEARADDITSVSCAGPGVERVLVSADPRGQWTVFVVAFAAATPLTWLVTAMSYALRRRARR